MKRAGRLGPGLGLVVVLAIGCGVVGGGGTQVTGLAGVTTVPTTLPAVTTSSVPPQDKGIVVVGVQLKPDPLGYFGGTAQVRNGTTKTHTASMTFTFTENAKVAGTAFALADDMAPGQTVTVQLSSTDKWDGGPVSFAFQVTSLY